MFDHYQVETRRKLTDASVVHNAHKTRCLATTRELGHQVVLSRSPSQVVGLIGGCGPYHVA